MNPPQLLARRVPVQTVCFFIWLLLTLTIGTAQATTFSVTTTANDGAGSLRQAIQAANADGSATAASPHRITFTVTGTITLSSPFLVVTNHVIIQGPGAGALTLSGGNTTRIFWLQNGAITIRDLTLANGRAKGGDGGGGGMGAGGAIFMHEGREGGSGSLAVQLINVTLTNNSAQGGNGVDDINAGGGMGGNGGSGGGGGVSSGGVGSRGGSVAGQGNGGIGIFGSGGNPGLPGGGGGFGGGGGKGDNVYDDYTRGGNGGSGGFGGGGGVGGRATPEGSSAGDGGSGGFGGGGGVPGKGDNPSGGNGDGAGGQGGYGGGGSAGNYYRVISSGFGGGNADFDGGGGGMGAGGAIFVTSGSLVLTNVTLTNNSATGGSGRNAGKGLGGAIFLFNKVDNGGNAAPGTTNDPTVTVSTCGLAFSGNTASSQNNQPGSNDNNQYGAFPLNGVAITQQPVSGSVVCVGSAVAASVGISGTGTGYKWYKNGILVPNRTAASLNLTNVQTTDAGSYSVVVTGTCNSLTSTAFSLTVNPSVTRLYVKADATGANTGLSWVDAFTDLQSALNYTGCFQSLTGTSAAEIWVAGGTYKPTTGSDRTISFTMKAGVAMYGGFVGTETNLGQRPRINPVTGNPSSTTLSGAIGAAGNSDNSYHVINNPSGLTNAAVLDGFVITGGNANGTSSPDNAGGGIYNPDGNPTVTNCTLLGNAATNGGGVSNGPTGNLTLTNCSLLGNMATFGGGGIYIFNSNPGLTNCALQGNTAQYGGAVYCFRSNPTLVNCSLQGNTATASASGGAMYSYLSSNPVLTNCVLFGNGGGNTFANNNTTGAVATYSLSDNFDGVNTGGPGNLITGTSPFASPTSVALNACSPAINAGNNAANTTATDLAGNPRRFGTAIDMGAVEFPGNSNRTVLTTQPVATSTVCAGSPVSVPVVATGSSLTYQWYKDGAALSSQTATSLNLTNVQASDAGSYSVVVTGTCNSLTSNAFNLTVSAPPIASLTNNGPLTCAQTSVTLTASGNGAYTFSSGASQVNNGPTATVQTAGVYSVTVVGSNGCSATASTTVTGNVLPAATRLYVNKTATGANTGLSWADALTDLQSALTYPCSQNLTEIWVAAGDYRPLRQPATNPAPPNGTDRFNTFIINRNVSLYGGFVGTETNLSQRPLISPVAGSGGASQPNAARPSSSTLAGASTDAFQLIRYVGGVTSDAVLDGFVLAGATGGQNITTSLIFYASRNDPYYLDGAAVGIYDNSNPTIRNCSFIGNGATRKGGAIFSEQNGTVNISNCVFQGNLVSGGLVGYGGATSIKNAVLTNCLFIGNRAVNGGGAVYIPSQGTNTLTNCTFVNNSDRVGGQAIIVDGTGMMTNCVLWNNGGNRSIFRGPVTARNSLFEPTVTNYTTDPTNVTTTVSPFMSDTDLSLNACSPAIDAGSNTAYAAVNGPATDLAGNVRIFGGTGGTIDMGAIEFQGTSNRTVLTTQPVAASTVCAGSLVSVPVVATGSSLTYQWYKDDAILSNQTSATLTLTNVQIADAGSYSVVVTGTCNSLTSTAFSLTVNALPTSASLTSVTLTCAQTSVTLTASGGTSYTLSNGQANTTGLFAVGTPGSYTVTVANASGCTAIATASVVSNTTPPTAILTASSLSFCAGSSVTLTAGTASAYSFSGPGLSQSGASTTALATQTGTYSVVVAGANGCTATASLSVTALPPTSLTAQVASTSVVCEGQPVSVSVGAVGSDLRYQWFKNNVVLNGQTGAALTLAAVDPLSSGIYFVQVLGSCGVVRSGDFTLSVAPLPRPTLTASPSATLSCAQPSLTLTAGGGSSYKLSDGQTRADGLFVVSQAGTYTVVVATASGCRASTTLTVSSNTTPPPATLVASNGGVLSATSPVVVLTATPGAASYRFSAGAGQQGGSSGNTATASVAGTYSVTVTGANGCTATASTLVSNAVTPVQSQTVCRNSRVVLVTNRAAARYEWYKNGQTAANRLLDVASVQVGSSMASLTLVSVQTTGSYYVKEIEAGGSFSWSGPFVVTVNGGCTARMGLAEPGEPMSVLSLVATPNPLEDNTLRASVTGAEGQRLTLRLVDVQGDVLHEQHWERAAPRESVVWDVSRQPGGLYILQALTTTQRQAIKVLKP